jgi:diphthamide synthase (EF-2-diphthine--ammonia ligase)
MVDVSLIPQLEALGVDPCGENGEFHTLVVNCPVFREEIKISFGDKRHHGNYWFIEMY